MQDHKKETDARYLREKARIKAQEEAMRRWQGRVNPPMPNFRIESVSRRELLAGRVVTKLVIVDREEGPASDTDMLARQYRSKEVIEVICW